MTLLPPVTLTVAPLAFCLLLQETFPSIQWFASLGVGGVLAGGMFLAYQSAEKKRAVERKEQEKRYADLALNFRQIVQENTKAIIELKEVMMWKRAAGTD